MKIYTKKGDQGGTDLLTKRVNKADLSIAVNGTIDEVMATILLTKHELDDTEIKADLDMIHEDLFQMAYEIALNNQKKTILTEARVLWLEEKIDYYDTLLEPLTRFIKLDQTKAGSWINMIRVTARRAERFVVEYANQTYVNPIILSYLNRLSDYMFTLGRYVEEVKR